MDQLCAELVGYGLGFAIIAESHLKPHHCEPLLSIDGFRLDMIDLDASEGESPSSWIADTLRLRF